MRNHTAKSSVSPSHNSRTPFNSALLVCSLAGFAGLLSVFSTASPAPAVEPNVLPQAYSAKIVDSATLSTPTVAPVVSMLPTPAITADSSVPAAKKSKKAKQVKQIKLVSIPTTNTVDTKAPADTKASPNSSLDAAFAALRKCESGGNYKIATGNGYYGAYQFDPRTWRSLGYTGLPSDAAPEVQDEAARKLLAKAGWGQWPACSRKLGLR